MTHPTSCPSFVRQMRDYRRMALRDAPPAGFVFVCDAMDGKIPEGMEVLWTCGDGPTWWGRTPERGAVPVSDPMWIRRGGMRYARLRPISATSGVRE